eukprot:s254_g15.t1
MAATPKPENSAEHRSLSQTEAVKVPVETVGLDVLQLLNEGLWCCRQMQAVQSSASAMIISFDVISCHFSSWRVRAESSLG